ncbi:hypothetical protein B0A50_03932 [Salinomyces thailandicus]|uniref:Uncharacterized protein n=1 Tax=Salinomyces thailandicus TaxID=706561 RepID=A0A4U0U335_9PEZI|nr:hypothetical protein B0A50_03932 [Salinomyces thailandica]
MSQDSLIAELMPPPDLSAPATPGNTHLTPPPSTQVPSTLQHSKTRTPTPTPTVSQASHISTPPPTIDTQSLPSVERKPVPGVMSAEEIASASAEELRTHITEMQKAMQEAKTTAQHYRLQHTMLAQESKASLERMAVEARMAQYENDVIHVAEQHAKATAPPVQPPPLPHGMIPVQKELYQRLCRDVQVLTENLGFLQRDYDAQGRVIAKQESEIASLGDKVTLMRERIRESRDYSNKMRNLSSGPSRMESTPRSVYSTPLRGHGHGHDQSQQPFAALLQASEMARQEGRSKKGHSRNTQSMSSLPATPARVQQQRQQVYATPSGRAPPIKIPSTAPMPRTSALRTPGRAQDVYAQPTLPVPQRRGPPSEGTVSASDREDDEDSEAETDIIDPEDDNQVTESQASRVASAMLRSSGESEAKRASFQGRGMLGSSQGNGSGMRQTKLFGQVRKAHTERETNERPAKKARTSGEPSAVGLGIAGVRD